MSESPRRIWISPNCSTIGQYQESDEPCTCGAPSVAYIREDIAEGMLAEATNRSVALTTAASEIYELLREHWGYPDKDAMELFLGYILSGIQSEWMKNPPANGITYTATFPEAGKLTISIRRTEGKSPAQLLNEVAAELEEAREDSERLEFVLANRTELWNVQLATREAIDAARKRTETT